IFFNFSDLDHDGKIRLDEMKSNILANSGNPLAVFDITGVLEFFLRAYVEINLVLTKITLTFEFARLKLLDFNVPFNRPAFLGTMTGDTLTLAIGSSSKTRIQGDLNDIAEEIHVSGTAGTISVWSGQFHRDSGNAQEFNGVHHIVAFGGLGDDLIDLSGVTDASITVEIHGGDGNDTIKGGAGDDKLFGDAGNDTIDGGGGADTISGGAGDDTLTGGPGNDTIKGDDGNDTIDGGAGADTVDGGKGNDHIQVGSDTGDAFMGLQAGSTDF